jgi:hypothetical protein
MRRQPPARLFATTARNISSRDEDHRRVLAVLTFLYAR